MREPKLLNETQALIAGSRESSMSIARNSGLGWRWVNSFRVGLFTDPGVNKTEILNIYLKSAKGRKAA